MHPVAFDAEYQVERNRLTTFFRLIVAIPWIIWMYLYGIAAWVAALIAWFVLLFTKSFPDSLYRFIGGYVEVAAQVAGFVTLTTDEFPPFTPRDDDSYPVKVQIAAPQVEYRRAQTFFKLVLTFPQQVLLYGIGPLIAGGAFITWWRILFTGKQSATMHDALRTGIAYSVRSHAFQLMLTEVHPRLLDLSPQQYPGDAPALPGPQQLPQGQLTQGAPAAQA